VADKLLKLSGGSGGMAGSHISLDAEFTRVR
jgi:hypothetical protein